MFELFENDFEKGLRIAETEENDECTIKAHIFLLIIF